MDMQLLPVYADEAVPSGAISVDPRMAQNLGVRTAPVATSKTAGVLIVPGLVRPDEKKLTVVQVRASGWLEKLYVRTANETVRRGQRLAELYSPEIVEAQEELLVLMRQGDRRLADAARGRLVTLGVAPEAVDAIARSHELVRRVSVVAPASGVVSEINVREGMAVNPAQSLFTLLDLSTVWVIAQVAESDAALVKQGTPAEVSFAALPGEVFKGRIDYVYPELNGQTRQLRARIALANPGGRLKPNMLAEVKLAQSTSMERLTVPSEAVITTGRRSVVIRALDESRFEPTEVKIGLESGGQTEILSGLKANERVVVSGQFLLDSEANLKGGLMRLEREQKPGDKNIETQR
jgi:Cu(I)/Ag(I) efflux system membrane fusion protein